MPQKPVLNSRRSVKRGSLRHAHSKSTFFFSSNSKCKAFSEQPQCTCSCIHWYLTSLLFKLTKRCFQAYTSLQQSMCTLLWSHTQVHVHVNGVGQVVTHHRDFSVQNHPCTEFRSLTTEIVNGWRFYCKWMTWSVREAVWYCLSPTDETLQWNLP